MRNYRYVSTAQLFILQCALYYEMGLRNVCNSPPTRRKLWELFFSADVPPSKKYFNSK